MQVAYPAAPHGSVQSGPFEVTNNSPTSGSAWVDSDVLLFEVDAGRGDAVTIEVDLSDDESDAALASGSVSWQAGVSGTQYVEFSGFPPRVDGVTPTDSCAYSVSVTNDADPNEGTSVWVNVYRG